MPPLADDRQQITHVDHAASIRVAVAGRLGIADDDRRRAGVVLVVDVIVGVELDAHVPGAVGGVGGNGDRRVDVAEATAEDVVKYWLPINWSPVVMSWSWDR